LNDLVKRVQSNKNLTVHLESKVLNTTGFKGNFSSQLITGNDQVETIRHGVTILATGGQEYRGSDYRFGTDPNIISQQQLEQNLAAESDTHFLDGKKTIVMIQCVGPAEQYCSRICCTTALKNALEIKKSSPDTQVFILYKDIRVYGFNERLYTEARNQGVLFFRYDDDHKPDVEVQKNDPDVTHVLVNFRDQSLGKMVELHSDLVVLSMPVIPQSDMKDVANNFKVALDQDGFFLEAHVKLRPVDFSTEGIYMAGMAHYPKLLEESLIQAQAAASRAAVVLSKDYLEAGGSIAVVNQPECTACLTCVRVCPFDVPLIQADVPGVGEMLGAAYIEPAVCQGCGICVAECPAQAIDLMHYTDAQLKSKVTALLNPDDLTLEMA
jgi:heterodisulfide reductase subunit A-like polyferredoxin